MREQSVADPSKFCKYLTTKRKLNAANPFFWENHRGGWTDVGRLINRHLHSPDGVLFVSAIEDQLWSRKKREGPFKEPWVGFMHQMPHHDLEFWDLDRIVKTELWNESIKHCLGLWTLTDYQKNYLQQLNVPVPVAKAYYPIEAPERKFSFEKFLANPDKQVLCIGEFLRNFQFFYDLEAPGYRKVLLKYDKFDEDLKSQKIKLTMNDSVEVTPPIDVESYDRALEDNIVLLNLLDAGAVTTVIECIVRGMPILVNRVGGVPEYLGDDYPLYCNSLEDATLKLQDTQLIFEAAEYLKNFKLKEKLTGAYFLASLQNTAIYRMLPVPISQQTQFRTADVSVIICCSHPDNLKRQLSLLAEQDFGGTFEILLWTNNTSEAAEVNEICRAFEGRLMLKAIHSSEDFCSEIRMALTSLIRSDLLLICDEDVLPQPNYISTFLTKHEKYGPDSVICASGSVFLPHTLDYENPAHAWNQPGTIKLFDESEPDRQVHFMYADSCLIPKRIMKWAAQYEVERSDFKLVDDSWLSFVFSHHMGIPIWKIKADDALRFAECSKDGSKAMFHNDLVNEQRINFYIYHMMHGWPASILLDADL